MTLQLNANQFVGNLRSRPRWLADYTDRINSILPFPVLLDPAQFVDWAGVTVTVGAAGAIATATSVPIDALTLGPLSNTVAISTGNVLIPAGTTLDFGGLKFATLTADAKVGDTSLTVRALVTALVDNDVARYNEFGNKYLPSGILIGRTYAERTAGTPFGPAATGDDEVYLTRYDIPDLNKDSGAEVVKHGCTIRENYLPEYDSLLNVSSNEKQSITISGTPTGGTFTLTFEGDTTTALAYNISAANMATALIALGTIGAGDVSVTGTTPYVVEFIDDMANTPQELIQADPGGLTGGTPAITVARTQAGGAGAGKLALLRQLYQCITGVD